jgi:hypothetical protein
LENQAVVVVLKALGNGDAANRCRYCFAPSWRTLKDILTKTLVEEKLN